MKRGILAVTLAALAMIAITGCQFVLDLVINPDLTVQAIDIETDSNGELSGITITFYNSSGAAENVQYAVYLSADAYVNSAADYKVYEGTFDIEWRQNQTVYLSVANDIDPFIAARATPPPSGDDYFIGVIVDPRNRIEEEDEADNDLTVQYPAQFGPHVPGFQIDIGYTDAAPLNSSNPLKVLIYDVNATGPSQFGVFPVDQAGSYFFPLSDIPLTDPSTTEFNLMFFYDSGNDWIPGNAPGPGDVGGSYNTAATGNVDFSMAGFTPIVVDGSYSVTFDPPDAPPEPGFHIDIAYTGATPLNSANPLHVIIYDVTVEDWTQYGVFDVDMPGTYFFPLSGIPFDDPVSTDFYLDFYYDSGNDWTGWMPGDPIGPGDAYGYYYTGSFGNVDFSLMYWSTIVVDGSYSITFNPPPPLPPPPPPADLYEDDDTWDSARWVETVDLPISNEFHTFDVTGDEDWFMVEVGPGMTLDIFTAGAGGPLDCDTVIELWDDGAVVQLDGDDDGGDGLYSWLSYTNPSTVVSEWYYVKVREFNNSFGEYLLNIDIL